MALNENLTDCVDLQEVANSFTPYHEISKEADSLTVYFKSDADYSKRLTDHVTLYLSLDADEIVGCRIKGITGIIEDLPNYLKINLGDVSLSLVFWSFRGGVESDHMRKALNELAKAAGDMKLESSIS